MKKTINFVASAITTILVASAMLFASCDKDHASSNNSDLLKSNTLSGSSPFDHIGTAHNNALLQLGIAMAPEFTDFVNKDIKTIDDQDSLIAHLLNNLPEALALTGQIDMNTTDISTSIQKLLDNIDNDSLYNTTLAEKIQTILGKYKGIPDLDDLRDCIRMEELNITGTSMSHIDTLVASCLNVYCHSLIFWEDASTNPNNPWYILINDITKNGDSYMSDNIKSDKPIREKIGKIIHKVGSWFEDVYQNIKDKYTAKNVAIADISGAIRGALPPFVGITGGNSILFSAAVMSAVGPLFM